MSYHDRDEPTTIDGCRVLREKTNALLITAEGFKGEHWIPKSQIDDDSEVYALGHTGKIVIPHWLAEDRGLA